jgi:hypothetical protein
LRVCVFNKMPLKISISPARLAGNTTHVWHIKHGCGGGMEATLPGLVAEVLLEVRDFVETACDVPELQNYYTLWEKKWQTIRRSTEQQGYVCEENLVVLMDFQIQISQLWTHRQTESFRSAHMPQYSNLQLELNSLISRMQWAILLQRMRRE